MASMMRNTTFVLALRSIAQQSFELVNVEDLSRQNIPSRIDLWFQLVPLLGILLERTKEDKTL